MNRWQMQRYRYPENWPEISLAVRVAAGWKCQRCGIAQGHIKANGTKVVLTVAHTGENKHDKQDCSHLEALCQACHLAEDLADHVAHAHETRRAKQEAAGQLKLWEVA